MLLVTHSAFSLISASARLIGNDLLVELFPLVVFVEKFRGVNEFQGQALGQRLDLDIGGNEIALSQNLLTVCQQEVHEQEPTVGMRRLARDAGALRARDLRRQR